MYSNKNFSNTLIVLVIALMLLVLGGSLLFKYIDNDFKQYTAEGVCVSGKIKLGYRRSQIETGNGTCWIKQNI